jgi:hypothetical protein
MAEKKEGLPNSRPQPYPDVRDKEQPQKSRAHEASLRKVERLAKKGQA